MAYALNIYCIIEISRGNSTIRQTIKWEEDQDSSQPAEINTLFRMICSGTRHTFEHLADVNTFNDTACRMLQHYMFRYVRRANTRPITLILHDDRRTGTLSLASHVSPAHRACR